MDSSNASRSGMTHLYYGPGKGKTTAAMGLVMRAAGRNFDISVLQFMKGHDEVGERYGEIELLRDHEAVEILQFPTRHAESVDDLNEHEQETLLDGIDTARRLIVDGKSDLVVLDELTLLCLLEVVDPADVIDLFEQKPETVELVVTGRTAPPEFVDAATYVTYMAAVKHPYQQGVTARAGIEF